MKKSSYMIFEGDGSGIVFMRKDDGEVSTVSVKNVNYRRPISTYSFRNIPPDSYQSPYISWANLNCCGGWVCDKSYLLTAVQEGKKLCAGITFDSADKVNEYLSGLSDEYLHCVGKTIHNGPRSSYNFDVVRKGCISDYIDIEAVKGTYLALNVDFLDFAVIQNYVDMPMVQLLDSTSGFDYANPGSRENYIATGLLLGYPLESTAALLLGTYTWED